MNKKSISSKKFEFRPCPINALPMDARIQITIDLSTWHSVPGMSRAPLLNESLDAQNYFHAGGGPRGRHALVNWLPSYKIKQYKLDEKIIHNVTLAATNSIL